MSKYALSSLKVLDLTHYIAGPYCTRLLAGLGARVIKVERPDGGDPARRLGPFPGDMPNPEKSGIFLYLNTSKKGITLNLKTEAGKKIFKDLVKDTDVVIENFEPRVMPSLGLDYETLKEINPRLVMTSISNYGQTGPYRDYKAQEINVVALGALMYLTGDPDREPLKEAGQTAQFTAGANASAATLAAVFGQKRYTEGQHVDISIIECVAAILQYTLTWSRSGLVVKRNGPYGRANNWPGGGADNGVYPCKDGYIGAIFSGSDEIHLGAALTGMEEFNDPDIGYMGFGKCVEDEKLNQLMEKAFINRDKEEVYRSAQELRLFWGAVRNIEEVVNSDHYQERNFWVNSDHPIAGSITSPRLPFIMSETSTLVGRAPLLGEHNEEVYYEQLGYSRQDLVRLKAAKII
jgi:crotonobetainyl-CoA:carnitine CoA-transferase CaiB-like acyl-CoA transferase